MQLPASPAGPGSYRLMAVLTAAGSADEDGTDNVLTAAAPFTFGAAA